MVRKRKGRKPTEKDLEFCSLFLKYELEGASTAEAATRAQAETNLPVPRGKGAKGIRALTKPTVATELKRRRETKTITSVISGAPLTKEDRENILGEIARSQKNRAGDRLKAVELSGKMNGDFVEKKQIDMRAVHAVKEMTDEELLKIIAEEELE